MKRLWVGLALLTAVWIAAMIQAGQPLGWDEIEFFRATKWTAAGQVPFRDFWEHHTPLQWFVFAPAAALFGNGAGAAAVVAMRWSQVAAWAAIVALLARVARRGGVPGTAVLVSAVFLFLSPTFVQNAVEYRVDVLGNLAYLAGVWAGLSSVLGPRRGFVCGVALALAVLANMRLAPLVVMTAVAFAFWRAGEQKWGWNRAALWLLPGAVATAIAFSLWLLVSGAWPAFQAGVFQYNLDSARLLKADTFWVTVAAPLWNGDVAGLVFAGLSLAGLILGLRAIARPAVLQFVCVLALASLGTVAAMEVQYPYHFQTTLLLLLPAAGAAVARLSRWQAPLAAVAAAALLLNFVPLAGGSFGAEMRYQDEVMRAADRMTLPGERVWDGTGYALRRPPAFRYWFLPTGLRFLASSGALERYDPAADPPAAIVYNLRLLRWFEIFPRSAFFAVHHYVPLYRNLWVPGLSARVPPGRRVVWAAPRTGTYDVYASEILLRHPWFSRPLEYAATTGPQAARYAIPLERLPRTPDALLQWRVGGRPAGPARRLTLTRGERVELVSSAPGPVGVVVVPAGVKEIGRGPAEVFEF